ISGNPNGGAGFEDALQILGYRYGRNYNSLSSASVLFPNTAVTFQSDNGDEYSDGGLMFTTTNIDEALAQDPVTLPWAGADNVNHFFTTQDLFDQSKTSPNFAARLQQAGTNIDSYNASTFYRMIEQV